MDIQSKVALITGASSGIGLAAARLLTANGAKVVLAARSADKLNQLADELKAAGHDALAVPTDVRSKEQVQTLVQAALDHFGRIDILINNAGQSIVGSLATLNLDDFQEVFTLNILGALYTLQAVVPPMRAAGGGLILNISSMTSKMLIPAYSGYASTKAMLNLMSNTARAELAPDNIRVITVYPRMTATNFGQNARGDYRELGGQRRAANIVPDSAEFVAEKILNAIRTEPAEQYMED